MTLSMQNKTKMPWDCRVLSALVLIICLCLSGCAGIGSFRQTKEDEKSSVSAVESADISMESEIQGSDEGKEANIAAEESSAAEASVAAETGSAAAEAETLAQEEEEKSTVLLFASDYQHKDGWNDPPVNFSGILDAVYHAGIQPDNVIFCGDYTSIPGQSNYDSDPHEKIEEIKQIVLAHDETLDTNAMIFEQGNHDEMTADISYSGLHEYEDYLVYVLNTENGFPWRQGKNECGPLVRATAERLKFCLDELRQQGEERPIIIAGHIPLQFTGRSSSLQGTGDNLYSRYVFEVLNEAGEELNLVFLYGHNHSRGWDSYLGGSCVFRRPGDWLLVPDPTEGETVTSHFTKETLTFTYLNAGYVGYFSSAGGEDTLTCTICELQEDGMVFSRYSEDGLHILSGVGTPNPAVDDRKLLPKEYYGQLLDSGQKVYYHTVEEKKQAA